MATAYTFTIDNLKTLIKIWMIERRELLKEEKSVQSVVDEEEKLPTAGMIPIGQVDDTYIIAQDSFLSSLVTSS